MRSIQISISSPSASLQQRVQHSVTLLQNQATERTIQASKQLKSSCYSVLSQSGSGKVYALGGGKTYRASAPRQAPAKRTGQFRQSWQLHCHRKTFGKHYLVQAGIQSPYQVGGHLLGDLLEHGTSSMAPRPYKQQILDRAMPSTEAMLEKKYVL